MGVYRATEVTVYIHWCTPVTTSEYMYAERHYATAVHSIYIMTITLILTLYISNNTEYD